jgi:hypothetical protein
MKKLIFFFGVIAVVGLLSSCTKPRSVVSVADVAVQSLLQSTTTDSINLRLVVSKTLTMRNADQTLRYYVQGELPKKIILMASCCASCLPECCQCDELAMMYVPPIESVELTPAAGGEPVSSKIETVGKASIFSLAKKPVDGSYILKIKGGFEGGDINIGVTVENGIFKSH